MKIFKLPDLGEGLPDAEIREWFVKVGDEVKADQNMVSMETAKAVVDVPAPHDGRIAKLYGEPGDVIKTGEPLVEFETGEEEPASTVKSSEKRLDSGTVAGSIEVGETVIKESATGVAPVSPMASGIRVLPAVRALANKLNVDLNQVKGSGPKGGITAEDVKRAAGEVDEGGDPIRGVRRVMAQVMSQSHHSIVPVTLFDDADIHSWPKKTDITLRVIHAVIDSCKAEPTLNAWFHEKATRLQCFDEVHIGLAMDSKEGLFVPVLRDTQSRNDDEIRADIDRYKTQVNDRSIPQDDLKGYTFMLSNFGTFAGRYPNPVIVPPCVAILGTGRIREEVVAEKGQAVVHRVMPLSLTFDHRAVTGGEATRFLAKLIASLASATG